jgi:hypothetical protein
MKCVYALGAIALLAVAYSLPHVEDSWDAEDDLVRSVQDPRPTALLLQAFARGSGAALPAVPPATKDAATVAAESKSIADANAKAHNDAKALSVAHAEKMATDLAKGSAAAASVEADWTKKELSYAKQAKALNKDARAAQRHMHDSLAKDKKDLKDAEVYTTKKITETNKGTAAAEAEYAKLQAEYKAQIGEMRSQDKIAAAEAAKRAAADKKELDKVHKELKGEVKETKKAQAAIVKTAKDLNKKKTDIKVNYQTKVKELAKQAKVDREKLEDEQSDEEKKFGAATKSNAAKAAAASKAVADEAAQNTAAAAKAKKEIDDRFAKLAAAKAKAEALYKAKADTAAAALTATREKTAKKFQKEADATDLQYKKAMEKADSMQAKAEHAQATYKQAMADAVKEAAAQKAKSAAQAAADMEIKTCGMDGSQCQNPDGSCSKVTSKGPYVAADLVSCTNKKPKEQEYAGESWAGIPPPAPLAPFPPATPDCKAKTAAFMATAYGKAIKPGVCPTVAVACLKVPDNQLMAKKQALIQYFDMAAACPPWCVPGSATSDGDNQDTHGICITGEDVNIYKQQIADLPEWKAMGTNNKIPANFGIISMCKMAQNFLKGFMDGAK